MDVVIPEIVLVSFFKSSNFIKKKLKIQNMSVVIFNLNKFLSLFPSKLQLVNDAFEKYN